MVLRKRKSVHCEYGSHRAWTLATTTSLPPLPLLSLSLFSSTFFSLPLSIFPALILSFSIANAAKATMAEPDDKAPHFSTASHPDRASFDSVSPGVARIEATAEHLTTTNRACILFGVLIAAWAYGLDNTIRITYQSIASNALNANAQLATLTVVKAVIGAASQVSDYFELDLEGEGAVEGG
jgi:hypothetical protein